MEAVRAMSDKIFVFIYKYRIDSFFAVTDLAHDFINIEF